MLKLFNDLKISYFLVGIVGAIALFLVFDSFAPYLVSVAVILLWIIACVIFLSRIASKRINRMLLPAFDHCRIEESLNRLYGIYKGRINNKMDLVIAIYICNLLIHFGKYDSVLKLLLTYDPETVFKYKREVIYKYLYYNTLMVCYSRLNRKVDALKFYENADKILNDPHFNKKYKSDYEKMHKINYLLISDNEDDFEKAFDLINEMQNESKNLLSKVSCMFSMVSILAKHGRIDETKEYVDFIKTNGGDTVYTKISFTDNLVEPFIDDNEAWEPTPIRFKAYKPIFFSVGFTVIIIALTVVFSVLTFKTIYVCDYDDFSQFTYTYDRNGKALSLEFHSFKEYDSEFEAIEIYNTFSEFLRLNDYEGCEVELFSKDEKIEFWGYVDFGKLPDKICNEFYFHSTEKDFLQESQKNECVLIKYKKALGITAFEDVISAHEGNSIA